MKTKSKRVGEALSLDDQVSAVRDAIRKAVRPASIGADDYFWCEVEVFPDYACYELDGLWWKRAWTLGAEGFQIGTDAVRVERVWVEVQREALREARGDAGFHEILPGALGAAVLETEGEAPVLRGVTLIKAGESANRRLYSAEMLRRDAAECFENAPAFVTNHNPHDKTLRNLVGQYRGVTFDEASQEVRGDLHVIGAQLPLVQTAVEAHAMFGPEKVGLSIDTAGAFGPAGAGKAREVVRLARTPQTSVDLVINPAAGGRLAESLTEEDTQMLERIREMTAEVLSGMTPAALRFVVAGLSPEQIREANPGLADAILARVNETQPAPATGQATEQAVCCCLLPAGCGCCYQTAAQAPGQLCGCCQAMGCCTHQCPPQSGAVQMSASLPAGGGAAREARGAGATAGQPLTLQQVQELVQQGVSQAGCAQVLENRIAGLGPTEQELLRIKFGGQVFDVQALDTEIARLRDVAGRANPNRPHVPGTGGRVTVTEAYDINRARLDAAMGRQQFAELNGRRYPAFTRISEALIAFHPEVMRDWVEHPQDAAREALGHFQWNGGMLDRQVDLMQETQMATTYTSAFADALWRHLLKQVNDPELNTWRQLVSDFVNFSDLTNTHKFVQVSELGTLTKRSEGETYNEVGTYDADRQQAMSISKYGDLYALTWEAMLRDDIGVIARIPVNLGRAWAWTVYDLVFGLFQLNSGAGQTMDVDSTACYDTSAHANLASSAFSAANLETVRAKLPVQTDPTSGKRKRYRARFLLYSTPALDQSVWEAVTATTKVPPTITNAGEVYLPNWVRALNLEAIPVIYPTATTTRWELAANPADAPTIAMGFLGGRQTPDIYIQDQETVGSRFTADKLTYKVRGTAAAAIVEWRSFSRGNV